MEKKSYWSLLIFCAILSQGIAILSDDHVEESSSLHVRRKRVIDLTRNGGTPIHLFRAPYIVNILNDGRSNCAGAILTANIIITAPSCIVGFPRVTSRILSNSALRNNGTPHRIVRKTSDQQFDFVMVRIFPPIELHLGLNAKIELFLGAIPPHTSAFFSGWGCTSPDFRHVNRFPEQLMQTKLPIIPLEECEQLYHGLRDIENHNICTFDATRRRATCNGDEGGPLVYQNRLLGILLHREWNPWEAPEVFVNFNNPIIHNRVNFHMNVLQHVD